MLGTPRGPLAMPREHLPRIAWATKQRREPKALDLLLDEEAEREPEFEIRDGVAILPITGPLFRRGDRLTRILGETAYDFLLADLRDALERPQVRAIALEVDSPGGDAIGLAEVADAIFKARRVKPVRAVVRGLGASAAYFLASAAGSVSVAREAMVGSIGTVLTILDFSGFLEQEGIQEIEIVSSQSPRKRPDPTTDSGRAQLQEEVDAIAQVFVDSVARYRGVSAETVLSDFGRGGVLIGEAAVEAGLADDVETIDAAVESLARRGAPRRGTTRGGAMARVRIDEITPEWLRENLPQVAESLLGEGRSEGREAAGAEREAAERAAEERGFLKGVRREHDRVIGVMQHAAKVRGCEDEGLRCLADPTVTAERAAGRLLQAAGAAKEEKAGREAEAGKEYLEDAARAEEENGKAKPSGTREEGESDGRVGAVKAMARKMGLAKEA